MAFQFPWTNLHELNLDWFLSKFKQFTDNFLGTTATAESVPYGTQPSVTVTGGELDEDTDVTDPFTFNFKIPAGQPGEQGEQGVPGTPGQDGFSPIATVTKSGTVATITITDVNGTTTATVSDGEVTQEQLDTKAPAITDTATGVIANFPDGADDMPVTSLVANIEPKQSGSGDPAPDNIRPISGWTGCNVTRAGKNLLSLSSISLGGDQPRTKRIAISTIPAGTYMFSGIKTGTSTSGNIQFLTAEIDGSIIASSTPGHILTLTEDAKAIYSYMNTTDYNNGKTVLFSDLQLELGSSATVYEPYQAETVTVDWTTEAGTVYGGTIDVRTGLLTVTDANIASYNGETLPSTWISDRDVYAQGTTPTTGAQVVYKLATPQTYQLTPQEVKTLLGTNNVRADTGDVLVTYPADTKMYIENLTQPTEDDMIANTAIANDKFFMIGNNLYRATTTIASGSQIIPGTNATALSLADALNLL